MPNTNVWNRIDTLRRELAVAMNEALGELNTAGMMAPSAKLPARTMENLNGGTRTTLRRAGGGRRGLSRRVVALLTKSRAPMNAPAIAAGIGAPRKTASVYAALRRLAEKKQVRNAGKGRYEMAALAS